MKSHFDSCRSTSMCVQRCKNTCIYRRHKGRSALGHLHFRHATGTRRSFGRCPLLLLHLLCVQNRKRFMLPLRADCSRLVVLLCVCLCVLDEVEDCSTSFSLDCSAAAAAAVQLQICLDWRSQATPLVAILQQALQQRYR